MGIATYKDFPHFPYGCCDDYPYRLEQQLTTNENSIVSGILDLDSDVAGGGDWPESAYNALIETIHNTTWRGVIDGVQVRKAIVLLTDAPPHDPEPYTGNTLMDVVTASILADPVEIYTIGYGGYIQEFSEIGRLTGGGFYSAFSTDDIAVALSQIALTIANPVVVVSEPGSLLLGLFVVLILLHHFIINQANKHQLHPLSFLSIC